MIRFAVVSIAFGFAVGCSQQPAKVAPQQSQAKAEPAPHPLWVAKNEAAEECSTKIRNWVEVARTFGDRPEGAALLEKTKKEMDEAQAVRDAAEKAWVDAGSPYNAESH